MADDSTSSQLRQRIRECMSAGLTHPTVVARWIRDNHHDLFVALLEEQAEYVFQRWVADAMRLQKVAERRRIRTGDIMDRIASGDLNAVRLLDVTVFEWRLGAMTREEHLLARDAYYSLAAENKHYGDIHATIARRLRKGQTTEERFTEDELRDIYLPYAVEEAS